MKSFKELFASRFPVNVVQYRDIPVHRKALQKLVFDFLDITTGDAESDKYLTKPEAYMLEKQGEFVAALIYRTDPKNHTVAYIRAFSVLSTERGKSYGFTLLGAFIDTCIRSGTYKSIQLAVDATNTVAIHLYDQWGFKVTKEGEDEGRKFLCMELVFSHR